MGQQSRFFSVNLRRDALEIDQNFHARARLNGFAQVHAQGRAALFYHKRQSRAARRRHGGYFQQRLVDARRVGVKTKVERGFRAAVRVCPTQTLRASPGAVVKIKMSRAKPRLLRQR